MYPIPILFIIFNRPAVALQAFQKIKEIRPEVLYIASDAARKNYVEEAVKVKETRCMILKEVTWPCEIKTLFQNENLGCGLGVYTAIDWFFQNESHGIILEDDCIVNISFFQFMKEMLKKYENDDRIGMVAGTNPTKSVEWRCSYCFSKYKSCWGWGTWRRAWQNMDINMSWRHDNLYSILYNSGFCGKDISGWKYKLKCIDDNIVSAWDWQWYFSLAAQNQLCIYPAVNLVSNIGNDANATHTSLGDITLKSYSLDFPLVHPRYVVPDYNFDKAFYKVSNSLQVRILRMIPIALKRRIKKVLFRIKNK